jgi:ATP-dependent Clp protease ATP-binding subunit ClpC
LAYLIGILIGLAVAWSLPRPAWFERLFGGGVSEPPKATVPSPPETPAEPATVVAAEGESLASRLYKLDSVMSPIAGNSAHPRELSELPEFVEAVRLLQDANVPIETVTQYVLGANFVLSCAALAALPGRPDGTEAVGEVTSYFDGLTPWAMHYALKYFLAVEPRPPVGAPLIAAKEWWRDNVVIPSLFRDYFVQRERLGDAPEFGPGLASVSPGAHAVIKAFLERVNHPLGTALTEHLDVMQRANVDRAFLTSFGRFWSGARGLDALIEPEPWREALKTAEAGSRKAPVRSLLASGDVRVGKTSFLRLLAKRLEKEGWTVFEASGADLMAGQQWFGQLEGRIQRTLEELAVSKKLIWYIPDILQIALSGTHQGQAASILDQILPAVTGGRLIIWTEASPSSTSRLLRLRPVLRGILDVIRLEPMDQDETEVLARDVAGTLSKSMQLKIDPGCIDTALSSAKQYLSASSFPGSGLDLLKLTVGRIAKGGNGKIEPHDVILTLSQLTGLPASILDNKERVDLAGVRAYFSARVIGQDEAVSAVVERIAMLKAGLNDPGKPIGVFLFAGPTGTGKTELAKTLTEFLFGSVERMIRLDMSEYQTADSTMKILGSGEAAQPTDSLITLVRKQPFSVVLLDEFEKAHANIWDLFLQVFDDGRLTDQLGQVADFRHTIIILTTNLGATSHRGSGLGFSPVTHAFSGDQVMRAVAQTFRPEFQNRLDKVIVFRELSRDLMRGILKKELARVLERRGLKDREWAVEWEASALEFLLEKGFSPEMGARPLKRAIDQYVVAPLAATIVEKRFPEGDQFVFVRSDGRAIQAEFVDPDEDTPGAVPQAGALPAKPPGLPAMILAPSGTESEHAAIEAEYASAEAAIASRAWEDLKASLSDRMLASDFWNRPDRHETLSRLALMDRVRAAASTASSLRTRLAKGTERAGKSSRELIQRLALQLHLIKEGTRDVFDGAPIEVVLMVEPTLERLGDGEAAEDWCGQLHSMYRAWASNRHMQITEVAGEKGQALPLLLISGFGAYRLLEREVGLHVLEISDDDGGSSRATARVRVAVAPLAELPADRLRSALQDALRRAGSSSAMVRRYRGDPAPLVRDMNGGWRSGRLDAVLRGDFDLIAAVQG